jgi:hypothetical protein
MRKAGITGLLAVLLAVAATATAHAGDGTGYKFTRIGTIGLPHQHGNHVSVDYTLSTKRGVVGTATLRCRIVEPRQPQRCSARSEFREGVIRARGIAENSARATTLPIVGGSGAFRKAAGTLKIAYKRDVRARFVYELESVG